MHRLWKNMILLILYLFHLKFFPAGECQRWLYYFMERRWHKHHSECLGTGQTCGWLDGYCWRPNSMFNILGLLEFTMIWLKLLGLVAGEMNQWAGDWNVTVWCDMWLAIGTNNHQSLNVASDSQFQSIFLSVSCMASDGQVFALELSCAFWKCVHLHTFFNFELVPTESSLNTLARVSMGIWPQCDGGC